MSARTIEHRIADDQVVWAPALQMPPALALAAGPAPPQVANGATRPIALHRAERGGSRVVADRGLPATVARAGA